MTDPHEKKLDFKADPVSRYLLKSKFMNCASLSSSYLPPFSTHVSTSSSMGNESTTSYKSPM